MLLYMLLCISYTHTLHLIYTHTCTEQQAQAGTRHHAIRHTRVDRAHHSRLSIGPHGLDDRRHDQRGDHRGKIDMYIGVCMIGVCVVVYVYRCMYSRRICVYRMLICVYTLYNIHAYSYTILYTTHYIHS